jgi:hypothetical protein
MKKSEWIIKATYNSDNPKKYCQNVYPFKGTPKQLENVFGNIIMKNDDYGKAEAVEVELIKD